MGNSVSQANLTTFQQLLPVIRRAREYRDVQKRVAKRLRINKSTVSKAASGRWPGRYRRVEVALLEELVRVEPTLKRFLAEVRAALKDGKR